MNSVDKQRFARYKKSYIPKLNEFDDEKYSNSNDKNKTLGHIAKIDVKIDELVKSLVKK
jgi:hypothetical protein